MNVNIINQNEKTEYSGEEILEIINRPYNWDQFKSLPKMIQSMYLKNLIDKYGATGVMISDMFGINPSTLSHYKKDCNLKVVFEPRSSPEDITEWNDFINSSPYTAKKTNISCTELISEVSKLPNVSRPDIILSEKNMTQPVEKKQEKKREHIPNEFDNWSVSLLFEGEIDLGYILKTISRFMPEDNARKMKITIKMENILTDEKE